MHLEGVSFHLLRRQPRILQHCGDLLSEVPDMEPGLRARDRIFQGRVPGGDKGREEAGESVVTSGPVLQRPDLIPFQRGLWRLVTLHVVPSWWQGAGSLSWHLSVTD